MFSIIGSVVSGVFGLMWSLVIGLVGLVIYILGAIGLYTLAKRRNIDHAWFSWIPFLQNYILGELDYDEVLGIGYAKWILLFGGLVVSILSGFVWGWVSWILDTLLYIYVINANYKLFALYRPQSAMVVTIIGIFIPILYPIWYFVIRNDR